MVSKPDYKSLPITHEKKNNAPLHVRYNDGTIHNVRLDAVAQADADSAAQRAALITPVQPYPSYTVNPRAISNTNQFYGPSQVPVLNQEDFGSCVTFSTCAALSYLTTGTTLSISPLYVLMQGYLDTNGFQNSGWDGLPNQGTLLQRILPQYQEQPGENQGYYPNYTLTNSAYDLLSQDYAQSGSQGPLITDQLTSGLFDEELTAYKNMLTDTSSTVISTVTANALNLTAGNANNAAIVKQALDNGYLVLVCVILFDANVPAGDQNTKDDVTSTGTEYYSYSPSTGVLTQNTNTEMTNTWVHPTGCVLGGHAIWLVSYATDELGNTMFFVRNSWGDSGDQGQYYMSDIYLNNAVLSGAFLMVTK